MSISTAEHIESAKKRLRDRLHHESSELANSIANQIAGGRWQGRGQSGDGPSVDKIADGIEELLTKYI